MLIKADEQEESVTTDNEVWETKENVGGICVELPVLEMFSNVVCC